MKIRRHFPSLRIGGVMCPCPSLDIDVFSPRLGWRSVHFLVDTGTTISIIPDRVATSLQLSDAGQMGVTSLRVGGSTRRGRATTIRVRFSEYPDAHFNWPCVLAAEPPAETSTRRTAPATAEEWAERSEGLTMPCLLGTAGFLSDDFDVLIEKETITLFNRRSWWRKNRQKLWRVFGLAAALTAITGAILYKRLR
jgi:hypothetical protein